MAYNNEKALDVIRLFHDNTMKKSRMVLKEAVKNLSDELIGSTGDKPRTPRFFDDLPTSGNTVANWKFSINSPDTSYDEGVADFSGEATKSQIRSAIQATKIKNDTTLYLSNSSPAMPSLEYGLYPLSPVVGSIHPVTGISEIRSAGGFSKQAPQGIIHVTAMKWPEFVADAQAKYAGPAS